MRVGKIAAFAAIMSGALWAQCASAQDALPPPPPPPGAPVAPPPGAAGELPPAVTGTNVNLRQGPGTTYPVITLIPAGTPVSAGGCNAGWCQVSFQGQSGYIIATAIAPPGGPGGPPPGAVAGPPPGAPPPGYYPPGYYPPPPPYYYGYGPYYGGYYGGPYGRGGYYGHRRW
jgi:hypothetical protein